MKYTVLFRGINVGGKNVVTMVDLRQLLLGLGLNKFKPISRAAMRFLKPIWMKCACGR